jgi:hypothetical protein
VALTAADADYLVKIDKGAVIAAGSLSELGNAGLLQEFEGIATIEVDGRRNEADHHDFATARPEDVRKGKQEKTQQEADGPDENLITSDNSQTNGKIPWRKVWSYFSAMGGWMFWLLLIFFFAAQQLGAVATNWWVRELSDAYARADTQLADNYSVGLSSRKRTSEQGVSVCYYFGIYVLIIGVYLVVGLLRLLLISFGSLKASAQIHQSLLRSIMNATFKFFE